MEVVCIVGNATVLQVPTGLRTNLFILSGSYIDSIYDNNYGTFVSSYDNNILRRGFYKITTRYISVLES